MQILDIFNLIGCSSSGLEGKIIMLYGVVTQLKYISQLGWTNHLFLCVNLIECSEWKNLCKHSYMGRFP